MEDIILYLNATFFGMLISLTIRWSLLNYVAHKLKSIQRGPLDRMIKITSEDILNGVIRKRKKQVKYIMHLSKSYDMKNFEDVPSDIPQITSDVITSIYMSFKKKELTIYLIPNEDIHLAIKDGLLSDLSHYFFNDEIANTKSYIDNKIIENKKRANDIENALKEKIRRQREQEIEDSINI